MIIDNIVHIDSPIYWEGEYQAGDELFVSCRDGIAILVWDLSEKTFMHLYNNPDHETMVTILRTHPWKRVR